MSQDRACRGHDGYVFWTISGTYYASLDEVSYRYERFHVGIVWTISSAANLGLRGIYVYTVLP